MTSKKIKLKALGLSYSQTESGAFVLVLGEEAGERRIPIIIGTFEAQSIAIELEGMKTSRPLTHDLFVNFATAFKIDLIEVNINRISEGIFYSELLCDRGGSRIKIDARTSDAVALAIRFDCPIYTNESVLEKAGIILKDEPRKKMTQEKEEEPSLKKISLAQLKKELQTAIDQENYEKASEINQEIKKRENK